MKRKIPLTKGKYALISDEDYDKVSKYKWCASNEGAKKLKWYAIRWVTANGRRYKIRMHRFIKGIPTGFDDDRVVDHKDGDGLNNTRENLRVMSQAANMNKAGGWRSSKAYKTKSRELEEIDY